MNVIPFRRSADDAAGLRLGADHVRLLSAALGLAGRRMPISPTYRNYLACEPGTRDASAIFELARHGLMRLAAGPMWRGQYVYVVTDQGRTVLQSFFDALHGHDAD